MVKRFRKKPVVIEAVICRDAKAAFDSDGDGLPLWLLQAWGKGVVFVHADGINITTLEGRMHADLDDWIIQGVAGEIYPCKPDIFEATYEPE